MRHAKTTKGGNEMGGISPKLPISKSTTDGYALTKTFLESSRQNLKNLILTIPGERMMIPDFGVGIKRFLFQNHGPAVYSEIHSRIMNQVNTYMPFIAIEQMEFFGPDGLWTAEEGLVEDTAVPTADANLLQIRIYFLVIPLDEGGTLDLDLEV